jgi:hypothetical protein
LLLLAAAGTFLAVAWDTMGLPARIAVVAGVTGAAILGGQRLRRSLPGVGAVVFHLGALLVPIDVFGLLRQYEVGATGTWLATGTTAVVTFGILALVGRSRVLAWAAVGSAPIAATGFALLTGVAAPVVLAGTAAVVLASTWRIADVARPAVGERIGTDPLGVLGLAAPVLAFTAVHLPLVVVLLEPLAPRAAFVADLLAAGWGVDAWRVGVLAGVLAVGMLAVTATRWRRGVFALAALISAATTSVLVAIVASTPEVVTLLALPVLALAVELAALATGGDAFWRRYTGPAAQFAEVAGAFLVPLAIVAAAMPLSATDRAADADLGVAVAVIAVAWLTAAGRRAIGATWRSDVVAWLVGIAAIHVAAAVALLYPGAAVRLGLFVGVAAASLLWLPLPDRDAAGGDPRRAAITLVVVASVLALVTSWQTTWVLPVAGLLAVVLAVHAHAASQLAIEDASLHLAALLPTSVGVVAATAAPGSVGVPSWLRAALAVVVLLAFAATTDRLPMAADLLRLTAAVVAYLAPLEPVIAGDSWAQASAIVAVVASPAAIVVTLVAAGWLVTDAWRLRRPWLAAFAAPVLVRALVSIAVGKVPLVACGLVLLVLAGAALVVALTVETLRLPAGTFALVAGVIGWGLLGNADHLRAWTIVAAGAALVSAGLLRRDQLVGHLGGMVMTLGTWWLLGIADVTATDVWVLPVAAQLWVAGWMARRRNGTSSWLTDVPPMLLVVIPALGERLVGGSGWHTLLAGVIGVVAVVGGGARRLGGPLIVGSLVLVALSVVETLALVATVPTWAWLALGGLLLLGAAVVIERSGGSPVATARRLVEVIDERFD